MTVRFPRPSVVVNTICNNTAYYRRFSTLDWKARHARNKDEYFARLNITSFNLDQRRKLRSTVRRARRELSKISVDWFDGKLAARLPFTFGALADESCENGYPHTVDNLILLSTDTVDALSDDELVELIKHEQTHIFQRKFPRFVTNFLKQHGYQRIRRQHPRDGIRANPDTDGVIYVRMGLVYAFPYRSVVRGLHSIDYKKVGKRHPRYEHPFEEMAYRISEWKNT